MDPLTLAHPLAPHETFVLDHFDGSPQEEVFAVGDVHGRLDLARAMLDTVGSVPRVPGMPRRLVFLGDLTDRGPHGVRVIDLVRKAGNALGHPVDALMGNHDMMLAIVTDGSVPASVRTWYLDLWLANGGDAVLDELARLGDDIDYAAPDAPDRLADALGAERVAWLRAMPARYEPPGGDVMLVHAGIHPYVSPEETFALGWRDHATTDIPGSRSWAWVREPFLDYKPSRSTGKRGHHGRFVVHGHTPQDGIRLPLGEMVGRDRLNLDAMAFRTGRLRGARILGNHVQVFEVTAPARD